TDLGMGGSLVTPAAWTAVIGSSTRPISGNVPRNWARSIRKSLRGSQLLLAISQILARCSPPPTAASECQSSQRSEYFLIKNSLLCGLSVSALNLRLIRPLADPRCNLRACIPTPHHSLSP